ncbi:MAG: permease [Candidatus Kapabacteria bacterium]|jgi:uncharacterized membrane protein YraQ (UPF0718 family)|nr:permease [Candidatus Kapabacteria bacterium]
MFRKNKAAVSNPKSNTFAKVLIFSSIILLIIDFIYKVTNNIGYENRQDCFLYQSMSKPMFLFYEYFIELFMILVAGIFVAVFIESYFTKYTKFFPKNSATAFLYASLLPVCSCGAIPLIESMREKLPFRVIITFIISAPLLNPYIIIISYSVLGWEYTVLRIISSFILAITSGYIVEYFIKNDKPITLFADKCVPNDCNIKETDRYIKSLQIIKKIFPYFLIAAIAGVALELYAPAKLLEHYDLNSFFGLLTVVVVGIPVYFCNGSDVLFLKPLMFYSGLPMGTAMAFSLTSTSVCFTSIIMMAKFFGKKGTAILVASVVVVTLILSWTINMLF